MVKKHLTRSNAPKCWPINKKGTKWITKPTPGPHPLHNCIPLNILIKNILKHAETTKQVKKILANKDIIIDKKFRRDYKFPAGLMDVIEIPKTKEHYRLILNKKGKFIVLPIKKEETEIKPLKIIGKKILKGNKIQLNLFDGRNVLVKENIYKVGDTVIFNFTKNKIESHLKFEKNSKVYLTGGKYIGEIVTINELNQKGSKTVILNKNSDKIKTSKDYIFIIGDFLKEYEKSK